MINMWYALLASASQDLGPSGPLHNNVDTMNLPYVLAPDTTTVYVYDELTTGSLPYVVAAGP
jgi:hypothetical protein